MYMINLENEPYQVNQYPIETFVKKDKGKFYIKQLEGIVPGFIILGGHNKHVVLLNSQSPKLITPSKSDVINFLTMEYNDKTILLYTSKQESKVSRHYLFKTTHLWLVYKFL